MDGGALFLDPQSAIFDLSFNQCNFSDIYSNSSNSKALSIGQSQLIQQSQQNHIILIGIKILNAFGGTNSAFLNAIKCNLTIQSMAVTHNQQFQVLNLFNEIKYDQLTTFQLQNSEVTINQLNFSNLNIPTSSSPLLMSATSSNVTIQNSIVEKNNFTLSLIDFIQGQLTIQNTKFQNIHQSIPKSRIIEESTQNNQGSFNSLIRITNSQLKINQNSVFNSISCLYNCQGSSILSQQSTLIVQDCRFIDSQSSNGGQFSVVGLNSINNIIENTYFINNEVNKDGGAFYLQTSQQDVFQLNFINSKFTLNKASQGYGGAIYIISQAQNTQQQNILLTNTLIYQNSALVAGGIFNQGINPILDKNSQIHNNIADYYGTDKFSYPQELYLINQNKFKVNSNSNQAKVILDKFKSGDTLPDIIFQLRDFKEITLIGKPGQVSFIEFTSDSIKIFNSNTQSYEQNYSYPIQVNFRECNKGEIISSYNNNFQECQTCDEGKYSLDFSGCYSCPSGGECTRGVILLKQGFWREEQYSSDIIECTNRLENCIGNSYGNAVCIEGNIGPLCEECDVYGTYWKTSYTKKNKFECIKCKEQTYNLWKLFLSILWIFFAVYLTVRRDKKNQRLRLIVNAFYKKNVYTFMDRQKTLLYEQKSKIYMKIFVNYIQIASAAVSFNLNIGAYVIDAISYLGVPISTSIDYLECLIKDLNSDIPLIYLKLIVSILCPLAILLVYLVYEVIIQKCYYKSTRLFSYSVYTASIFLFLYVQPDLVSQMIGLLSCRKIMNTDYILINMNYQCYTDTYKFYSIALVLPFLILCTIVLPAFLFIQIYISQRRHGLNDVKINLKYGFLFQEYKDSVYFWEIIKIIQKIVIIILLNFYSQVVMVKGILIYLVILFYGVLSNKYKPYQQDQLNKIDNYSTQICAFTILLCVFINNNQYNYLKIGCFIIIVLINSFFIIYIALRILKDKYNQVINLLFKVFEKYPSIQKYFKQRKIKINPALKQKIRSSLKEFAKLNQNQIKEMLSSIRNTKTTQQNQQENDNQLNSKQDQENIFLQDLSPTKQLDSIPNSHRQMLSIETDSSNFNTQMINSQTERLYASFKPKSMLSVEQKHLTNSQKPINVKFKISYLQAHSGDIQEDSQNKENSIGNQIEDNQKQNVTENSQFKEVYQKGYSETIQNEIELIKNSQIKDGSQSEQIKIYQNI
ncbi:transmembrane protein, putative (macronuclear) [Tetrahymena thermophila SB210]|uniref:Transmembrane protein, putative n=1 Tax=Tetrahymena thermophila (strain SB210) TaxID=312017 RepID=W7X4N4_TETTS|nr:transmembrane protein, putative [Tetrahymena thermophila SB210]EWS71338.1 transmembrane protein, putative [Tetrahymena thermophila SB210]|eukprot:XP_012656126.1 transmembrane protein, putative [Tetrahymena thermophila SB210]